MLRISILEVVAILSRVGPRERQEAQGLREEEMRAGNVAGAKALEARKAPVVYHIHETPSREKLVALQK